MNINERGIWDTPANPNDLHDLVIAGGGLAVFSSFFNHSCYPDVGQFTNEEGEILHHAMKPIKKGSQVKAIFAI